jgi:diguanylate cyclase (GGDEF)-like protein
VLSILLLVIVFGILVYSGFLEYRNGYREGEKSSSFLATIAAEKITYVLNDADYVAISAAHLLQINGQISANKEKIMEIQALISSKPHILGYLLINASGQRLTTREQFGADISTLNPDRTVSYHRNNWIAPTISSIPGSSAEQYHILVERGVWSSDGVFLGVATILVDLSILDKDSSLLPYFYQPRIILSGVTDSVSRHTYNLFSGDRSENWFSMREINAMWTLKDRDSNLMGLSTIGTDGIIISRQKISGLPLTVYVQSSVDPFLTAYRIQRTVVIATGGTIILLAMLIVAIIRRERKQNKESQKKLSLAEERLQFSLATTRQGLWDWWVESDQMYYSDRIQTMLGYPAGSWRPLGKAFFERLHPEDQGTVEKALTSHFDGEIANYCADFRLRNVSNEWVWIRGEGRVVAWAPNGKPSRMIGTNRDINDAKMREINLEYAASHDTLLGIPNRHTFHEHFERLSTRAGRRNRGFSFIMFDIDSFKSVNDTHGHPVGDEVLKLVVETVKTTLRSDEDEKFFRLGGEEFGILLSDADSSEAQELAERLRVAIEAAYLPVQGKEVKVTASFGLTIFQQQDTLETLMERADKALYEAKKGGRNKVTELIHDTVVPD